MPAVSLRSSLQASQTRFSRPRARTAGGKLVVGCVTVHYSSENVELSGVVLGPVSRSDAASLYVAEEAERTVVPQQAVDVGRA